MAVRTHQACFSLPADDRVHLRVYHAGPCNDPSTSETLCGLKAAGDVAGAVVPRSALCTSCCPMPQILIAEEIGAAAIMD